MTRAAELDRAATEYRGGDLARLAAQIMAKEDEAARLERLVRPPGEPRPRDYWRKRQEADLAHFEIRAMQRAAALDYGVSRGWTLSQRPFGIELLRRGKSHLGRAGWNDPGLLPHFAFDHAYFYRRERRAAAIVAHLYGWPHHRVECEALAARQGLVLEVPGLPSWWFSKCTMVVWTTA